MSLKLEKVKLEAKNLMVCYVLSKSYRLSDSSEGIIELSEKI